MFRQFLTACLLLAAMPAAAGPTQSPTEACLVAAASDSDREACIGETARACQASVRTPDPLDIAMCINGETEWWQDRITEAYDRMMIHAAHLDELHKATIAKGAPRLTDDLVEIQASWKDWTEKRCTLDAMLMRGSPQRMVVAAECMLQQTARQTLLLERSAGYTR